MKDHSEHSIAFICTANICRSPMAHAIFAAEAAKRGIAVTVLSAGVWDFEGTLAAVEARLVCERYKTPMPKFVSTHVANVDLTSATRIFAMEQRHVSSLLAEGISPDRISLLGEFDPQKRGGEIEDPIGGTDADFERCYERLHDCIVHYLDTTNDFHE